MSPPRKARRCSIKGCPSVAGRQQHRGVKFNELPLNKTIRQYWLTNCGVSDPKSLQRKFLVCSRHFHRADFQHLKKNTYLLKDGAVPTIFPWGTLSYVEPTPHTVIKTDQPIINKDNDQPGEINQKLVHEMVGIESESVSVGDTGTSEAKVSSFPVVTASQFSLGTRIKVQGLDGFWHSAKVMEVDDLEKEVFLQFEKTIKSEALETIEWMEWIPMNSSRFRPFQAPVAKYMPGEKCLARWITSSHTRKFPATVQKVLDDNMYEVRFDDGFVKVVRGVNMSKSAKAPKSAGTYGVEVKTNPHMQIPKIDLSKLNLRSVPKDGEWCCNWVNQVPVGVESYLQCPDGYKRPTVIVEDLRLPAGWTKHVYPRPNELGTWDVVLIGPTRKRFRTRNDVKMHLKETGEVYDPDIYDFGIHKRRAKELGLYIFTDGYKDELKNKKLLAAKTQEIQLLDQLFCCPEPGCNKKFRKENQLQAHNKHYHIVLANQYESGSDTESERENQQYEDDQPMKELILKDENIDPEWDLENQHIDDDHIEEIIPKNEIPDAGPVPVAIYKTPNFETFVISHVDSKYGFT